MPKRRGRRSPVRPGEPTRVLLISASMGAGHDGAARQLAARLNRAGHHAEVRDFLDSGPFRIGGALRRGYQFELQHLPFAYEATYRLWYRLPWLRPLVTWLVTVLTRRKVLAWIRQFDAAAVVSTYPLATLCLGRLRKTRRLAIPTVNFITDFGVHPLWVHPGIDVNLAVHDEPARLVARHAGKTAVACGPVVSDAFDPTALPDRQEARAALGLRPSDRAVLVVAGSWGVGGVQSTWQAIIRGGCFTPVVVCGRDERLRLAVTALAEADAGNSVVLGWTEDMPALMSGCDALVENAGGLTSFEAMRAGLPVVSFQPIAGHGRENTARMDAAGVSRLASSPDALVAALQTLSTPGPERAAQVAAARAIFRHEADVLTLEATAAVEPVPLARRPAAYAGRAVAAVVGVAALGWIGLTTGVDVAAAAAGAGVAHPPSGATNTAFVGVRLNAQELTSRPVQIELQHLDLSAVVDRVTARTEPRAVRTLAGLGVSVASGGQGDWTAAAGHDSDPSLWARAEGDAEAGRYLAQLTGAPVTLLVPGRRVNAWDLIDCGNAHSSLVMPDHIIDARRAAAISSPLRVRDRRIYLINGLNATPAQLGAVLDRLGAGLAQAGLVAVPLDRLA